MEKKDRINLVIVAMERAGLNNDLNNDGKVGKQAAKAAARLITTFVLPDRINMVIKALKEAGFNGKLVADGEVGIQCIKAIGRFLALASD